MKLVGYIRVSKEEENPENQRYAIYEWAAKNGHVIVAIHEDIDISGALPPRERPGFQKVLKELANADGLVVYALDRLARSMVELVDVVRELEASGKVVLSVRENWLQSLDPKIRSLILAILGWTADMERELIRARTKEALARVKAQGKRLGRPPKISTETAIQALKYVEKGYSLKDVARILGVGYTTLACYITNHPDWREKYYEARARSKMKKRKK
jgi:DNA invertase Pin-like site-specific DNA recombinase